MKNDYAHISDNLIDAVVRSDAARFESLLNSSHPDASDPEGFTILMAAAIAGDCVIIDIITASGKCDIDRSDDAGNTALIYAAMYGNSDAAGLLMSRGASAGFNNNSGMTAVQAAEMLGHKSVVKAIKKSLAPPPIKKNPEKRYVQPVQFEAADFPEETAKKPASRLKSCFIAYILLMFCGFVITSISSGTCDGGRKIRNADFSVKVAEYERAQNEAAASLKKNIPVLPKKEPGIVEKVMSANAAEAVKIVEAGLSKISEKGPGGVTLLMAAANQGNVELLRLLLKNGARVNERDKMGCSALYYAAYCGYAGIVKILLENSAEVGIQSRAGGTPLFAAAQKGHSTVAAMLIEKGAAVDSAVATVTPLMTAALNGHVEVVKLLVEKGANLRGLDSYGNSAFHKAAMGGRLEVIKYLVEEKNMALDEKNLFMNTALHLAAMEGKELVVLYLIGKGADYKAKNFKGQTPLSAAREKKRYSVIKAFRVCGIKE